MGNASFLEHYTNGVAIGLYGAIASVPVYGVWPNMTRLFVIHPLVHILSERMTSRSVSPAHSGMRGLFREIVLPFAFHGSIMVAMDIITGAASPLQVCRTFASCGLLAVHAIGIHTIFRCFLQYLSERTANTIVVATAGATYLAFGFALRELIARYS